MDLNDFFGQKKKTLWKYVFPLLPELPGNMKPKSVPICLTSLSQMLGGNFVCVLLLDHLCFEIDFTRKNETGKNLK